MANDLRIEKRCPDNPVWHDVSVEDFLRAVADAWPGSRKKNIMEVISVSTVTIGGAMYRKKKQA